VNYTHLLQELNKASSFDLHRLRVAIDHEIESPARIIAIKQKLRIGMDISFFCDKRNQLVPATLLKCHQKRALVVDKEGGQSYNMPYYMLNVDHVDTDIYQTSSSESLTANNLKIGERVGFKREGDSIVGTIVRLNQKTVTINTSTKGQWRVAYAFLYKVYEGEMADAHLILAHEG
jgi:hypothetical protein